jgi:hypothetical protein
MKAARRLAAMLLLAVMAPHAQAQTLEVIADTGRITVGDPVSVRLVLRQYEGDALLEQVPHPLGSLADGVRLLSVDSMRSVATRRLEARARMAFYRPGRQTIPAFAIDFRRGAVILHGTMTSEPVPIEITPVLMAGGGPTLRDIKEIVESPGPDPRIVLLAAGIGATLWLLRRPGRRGPLPLPVSTPGGAAPRTPPDPFAAALDRLAEIESADWAGAEVERHYSAVTDTLRDYLAAAEGIPARERTSGELLTALPPHLAAAELRAGCVGLLSEADLVKFARRRPDRSSAVAFLSQARGLLASWREAARPAAPAPGSEVLEETANAVR